MDNTKRPYEDYKKEVFQHLKKYGNFKNPSQEAKEYMESREVDESIRYDYEYGSPPESCAWGIDMMY